MHELSESQRQELLKNPHVEKITDKFVSYTSIFKIKAVELYLEGQHPDKIFLDAQIPIHFFRKDYPRYNIKRWKKKYQERGAESLKQDGRGSGSSGRPRKESLDELTYDELLTIVEIQREVIEDLKKRNALAKKKKLKS
jgi:transposase